MGGERGPRQLLSHVHPTIVQGLPSAAGGPSWAAMEAERAVHGAANGGRRPPAHTPGDTPSSTCACMSYTDGTPQW
jgi:hypothetical protein